MDPRKLLDALELRLGAMDQKRLLATEEENREIKEVILEVCD